MILACHFCIAEVHSRILKENDTYIYFHLPFGTLVNLTKLWCRNGEGQNSLFTSNWNLWSVSFFSMESKVMGSASYWPTRSDFHAFLAVLSVFVRQILTNFLSSLKENWKIAVFASTCKLATRVQSTYDTAVVSFYRLCQVPLRALDITWSSSFRMILGK